MVYDGVRWVFEKKKEKMSFDPKYGLSELTMEKLAQKTKISKGCQELDNFLFN